MTVKTAVLAVAGLGTRFLPATKSQPKELLPILDKPVIQYLVEEAARSGIENVILVTRPGGDAMQRFFERSPDLEAFLEGVGKQEILASVRAVSDLAKLSFAEQGPELPYGNGSPLIAAKPFLEPGEPFVYMFGDDLVKSERPCVQQLIDVFTKHSPDAVVAVQSVPQAEACRYGIIKLKNDSEPLLMDSIVEKPKSGEEPSTLAQFGRFVLPYETIEILERQEVGQGNELWLTDAIATLCAKGNVAVHPVDGMWLTTGDPLRFLIANVEYALSHEIADEFRAYLKGLKL